MRHPAERLGLVLAVAAAASAALVVRHAIHHRHRHKGHAAASQGVPEASRTDKPRHLAATSPIATQALERGGARAGESAAVDLGAGVLLQFVWIPPGEFAMGSPPNEPGREPDETPHTVRITKGFWMGKHEVTVKQWLQTFATEKERPEEAVANSAVAKVSWDDAQDFVARLNARSPAAGRFRLPTEAEWEYACRAGTATPVCYGDSLGSSMANFNGEAPYGGASAGPSYENTMPVGSFKPNAWGLHDMHGNVSEWCADWYGPYPTGTVTDPAGPPSGPARVIRGGSWRSDGRYCRSAQRSRCRQSDRINLVGFRVVFNTRPLAGSLPLGPAAGAPRDTRKHLMRRWP